MQRTTSKYINFIANLLPAYHGEWHGGFYCARSLRDGTLLLPHQDTENSQGDMITVWWQGDPNRSTDAIASMIASNAVAEYVQQASLGKSSEYSTALLLHLMQHFEHKTGDSLYLPYAADGEKRGMRSKAISLAERLGLEFALEALKKLVFLA